MGKSAAELPDRKRVQRLERELVGSSDPKQ